ncbi:MAG: hypothetical protein ACI4EF_08295 [Coprococcus sp.]
MEQRDINEIRAAIKYMDYKPALLAKFYDIKSLLFAEIMKDEDYYKVSSIMPNPLNDNKIVKCINILDKKYIGNKEKSGEAGIPEKAVSILKSIKTKSEGGEIYLSVGSDITADVYLSIPRGNSVTINSMKLGSDVWISVMNSFNAYTSEGFTLAIRMDDMAISIEPSALDGIKGQGDVFIYVMTEYAIYKGLASNYFNTEDILSVYRG